MAIRFSGKNMPTASPPTKKTITQIGSGISKHAPGLLLLDVASFISDVIRAFPVRISHKNSVEIPGGFHRKLLLGGSDLVAQASACVVLIFLGAEHHTG